MLYGMQHSPQLTQCVAKLNIDPDNAISSVPTPYLDRGPGGFEKCVDENTYYLPEDQVQHTTPELLLSPTLMPVSAGMPLSPLDEGSSVEYGFPPFGDSSSQWTIIDASEDQQFQNWLFYGRITFREQLTSTIHSLSPSFDIKLPRPLQLPRSTSTSASTSTPPVPQEPYYLEDPFRRGSAPYVTTTSAGYQKRNVTNNDLFDFSIYESSSVVRKYDTEEQRSRPTSLDFHCKSDPRPPLMSTPSKVRFIQLSACEHKSSKASVHGSSRRRIKHEAQGYENMETYKSRAPIQRTKRPQLRQLILPQRVAIAEALSKQRRPVPPRSLMLPAQLAKRALCQAMRFQELQGGLSRSDSGELRSNRNHDPNCADRRIQTNTLANIEYRSCSRVFVYHDHPFSDSIPAARAEEGTSQEAEEVRTLRLSADWEAELISEYLL